MALTKRLKDILEEIGISRNEVKTNHFSINPEYKRIESNNSNFNTKLIGYRYNHDVIIRFDIENQLLDKVLEAVSKIEQKPPCARCAGWLKIILLKPYQLW